MKLNLHALALAYLLPLTVAEELRGSSRELIDPENTIVGGSATSSPSWFVHFGNRNCGASLITADIVLTAAHCVESGFPTTVRVAPTISTSTTTDGLEVSVDAANSVIHPLYVGNVALGNDVAIIKLATSVDTNTYAPVTLNCDCNKPGLNAILQLYGYGLTSSGGTQPDNIQTLQTQMQCISSTITYISLLASDTSGACFGDSGGPAVIGNTQMGLASFVRGDCAIGNPDGYARISTYYSWIQEQVCAKGSDTTNFDCSACACARRAVADGFARLYFGAAGTYRAVSSFFGGGGPEPEGDVEVFPMGPR